VVAGYEILGFQELTGLRNRTQQEQQRALEMLLVEGLECLHLCESALGSRTWQLVFLSFHLGCTSRVTFSLFNKFNETKLAY
jgi:hypothetical protein